MRGALLGRLQRRLEHFYSLDASPNVLDFVREREDGGREELLVRELDDYVELALLLPSDAFELEEIDASTQSRDTLMQAVEGVSHFVYLAEHLRTGLPTTLLELELQAEVDKFVVLTLDRAMLSAEERDLICEALFERVQFTHRAETELGARYRLANTLAARYLRRLAVGADRPALRRQLHTFYRAGQTDKIRLAQAA